MLQPAIEVHLKAAMLLLRLTVEDLHICLSYPGLGALKDRAPDWVRGLVSPGGLARFAWIVELFGTAVIGLVILIAVVLSARLVATIWLSTRKVKNKKATAYSRVDSE